MYDTKEEREHQARVLMTLPPLTVTPAPPPLLRLAGAEEDETPEPHIVRGID